MCAGITVLPRAAAATAYNARLKGSTLDIYCLFFNDYETLDLMGPIEFLHRIPDAHMHYVSRKGGLVRSRQGC